MDASGRHKALRILAGALPDASSATPGAEATTYCGQECIGLENEWKALHTLLGGSVMHGLGNSCMVVGANGCGKSLLVSSVLRALAQEKSGPINVVTLSALMHPTDRACVRAMARQLLEQGALHSKDVESVEGTMEVVQDDAVDEEMPAAVEEDSSDEDAPLAATMLAKEAALADEGVMQDDPEPDDDLDTQLGAVMSTMSATLAHLLGLLSSGAGAPLVVVLDQFDVMAQRVRQSFMYCLLDAVQSGSYQPGFAVVGLTCRVDAGDFLEKRVKSRFSHRIIHLLPLPFDKYAQVARTALLGGAAEGEWHDSVERVCGDSQFVDVLKALHSLSGDIRLLYQALTVPVACSANKLSAAAFADAAAEQQKDYAADLLLELTEPEMAVLVTARHLQMRDKELFTFEMCFQELEHFVKRIHADLNSATSTEKGVPRAMLALTALESLASRETILKAFYNLVSLELLLPESARLSLSLPSGVASRSGPVTNAYSHFPSATVIPEFLPVRTSVSGRAILESTSDPRRTEPLNSILVKWAESTGVH
ncbi:origin recognition complex subunit 4 [Malassezia cuniculi]|uniref:Origin recognition complex subunit 4 n=1 Tax=Malassezia cuniculi TaxID=948313 RepID=A0AAF0ETR1_9BASI|nr:origin recognition complex subunit 4 [Malassezia cuniculi]